MRWAIAVLFVAGPTWGQDATLTGWDAYEANRQLAEHIGLGRGVMAQFAWPIEERPDLALKLRMTGLAYCERYTGTPEDAEELNTLALAAMDGLQKEGKHLQSLVAGSYTWMLIQGDTRLLFMACREAVERWAKCSKADNNPFRELIQKRAEVTQALADQLQQDFVAGERQSWMAGVGLACVPYDMGQLSQLEQMWAVNRYRVAAPKQMASHAAILFYTGVLFRDWGQTRDGELAPLEEATRQLAIADRMHWEGIPDRDNAFPDITAGMLCADEIMVPMVQKWIAEGYNAQVSFPPTAAELGYMDAQAEADPP